MDKFDNYIETLKRNFGNLSSIQSRIKQSNKGQVVNKDINEEGAMVLGDIMAKKIHKLIELGRI